MSTQSSTADPMAALRERLGADRVRWGWLAWGEAIGLAGALLLAGFLAALAIDAVWPLPLAGRIVAWLALAALLWLGWLRLRQASLDSTASEEQVALAIERETPGGLDNRLINAVQLARDARPESAEWSARVVEENVDRLRSEPLADAVPWQPAYLALGLLAMLTIATLAVWIIDPSRTTTSAARLLLPLAPIEPQYRTQLDVLPGDAEAQGEFELAISISGERPGRVEIERWVEGVLSRELVSLPPPAMTKAAEKFTVTHTLRDLRRDTDYRVLGGDYASPTFHIRVPRAIALTRLRARYRAPEYVRQDERVVETASGELAGLAGSDVELLFEFDQPVESAELIPQSPDGAIKGASPIQLTSTGARTFAGKLRLESLLGYRLNVTPSGKPTQRVGPYSVRILPDRPPRMELTGWESGAELPLDGVAPLAITADDDFGLRSVGLLARRVDESGGESPTKNDWLELKSWEASGKLRLREAFSLAAARLNAADGEKVEVLLRAKDNSPSRSDWVDGPALDIVLGDGASSLQREYEQIQRAESSLAALVQKQDDLQTQATSWLRRVEEPEEGVKWSDPPQLAKLHAAVQLLATESQKLRESAATTAKQMPAGSGNLRLGLSLLADSEFVRSVRIAESVPSRDELTAKQAALADLRITQERILRSLRAMSEDLAAYRIEWEVAHTVPYLQMLAARQAKLRDQSQAAAKLGAEAADLLPMSLRRQEKLNSLLDGMQAACQHVSERLKEDQPDLASAFGTASQKVVETNWRKPFAGSVAALKAKNWKTAADEQQAAAARLGDLVSELQKAHQIAAQKILAALKDRAKTDPLARIGRLIPGSAESFLKGGEGKLPLPELIRMQEIAAGKKKAPDGNGANTPTANLGAIDPATLEKPSDTGVRQDPSTLRLGTNPEATVRFELPPGDERNKVTPFLQEEFDDLVGKLLEEADELGEKYDTLRLSTNQNNNDPGEIQKQGGRVNSTGAVAATGNKKPPTTEGGGAARVGRQGARATGAVAADQGVDRRGRDKALDGQEEIADQPGTVKLAKSDDPQKDHSTGVGGKRVESDDTHFSTHDAGRWKDDHFRRMDKPQAKQSIVERQGDPVDPKLASQLRDLTSRQEQVIERLKTIKKELNRLYLPSDHLDQLAATLQVQLDRLREQPDPELFRLQLQTLDRLRGALAVFRTASNSFQPSLPRERGLRMRVVDEPAALALPGYEEATARYYQRLSEP